MLLEVTVDLFVASLNFNFYFYSSDTGQMHGSICGTSRVQTKIVANKRMEDSREMRCLRFQ